MSVFNFMAIHQIYLGGISDWTEVVHRPTQRWTAASVAKKHPHDVMSQTPKGASSVSFHHNTKFLCFRETTLKSGGI